MASFYYNYQNPSGFCFLMLMRAIVLCPLLGLQNFEFEMENEMNSAFMKMAYFGMAMLRVERVSVKQS